MYSKFLCAYLCVYLQFFYEFHELLTYIKHEIGHSLNASVTVSCLEKHEIFGNKTFNSTAKMSVHNAVRNFQKSNAPQESFLFNKPIKIVFEKMTYSVTNGMFLQIKFHHMTEIKIMQCPVEI